MKVLIGKKTFYVKDTENDFHTEFGFIKASDLKKQGVVKTNKGEEFSVFDGSFIDSYRKISRAPQIIPRKDIGIIIAETGLGKNSRVLDAGTGSGALACFLANICKEVISYEIREDFLKVAEKNKEFMGLKNLKIKHKDVYEGISEKNLDAVILDLPEPWKAVKSAITSLKAGGFLVSYSPSVPQVSDFINSAEGFFHIKTIEIMEREWEFSGRKIRPKSQAIGHSGFITFMRKA